MSKTEKGSLEFGIEHDGVLHYDVEMRLATVQDNIDALDEVGAKSGLRITLAMYARAIVSIGAIPRELITTTFLAENLADSDFDALGVIQGRIKKKRRSAKLGSQGIEQPPLSSDGTASPGASSEQ